MTNFSYKILIQLLATRQTLNIDQVRFNSIILVLDFVSIKSLCSLLAKKKSQCSLLDLVVIFCVLHEKKKRKQEL